jgi:hypothetical protein
MLDITLTLKAAPELLAALINLTNSITSSKEVIVPQSNSEYTFPKSAQDQIAATATYIQSTSQSVAYLGQDITAQQTIPTQQPAQNQVQVNFEPVYNQTAAASVNPISNQQNTVHVPQQATFQTPPTQPLSITTSTPTYTMEQLAVAATHLVDAGRRSELVSLLQTFGVQALIALPKEQYGAFATQLRALGAKI